MKDAQKPDHRSLNSIIKALKEGQYVIPDFQREFEWMPWDIRDFMRSIFLDYYIGSLLLWRGTKDNFEALSCESIYGYTGDGEPKYIVLDGQQRLTAMYYCFFAPDTPLPNRSSRAIFYIKVDKFMAEDFDEAFDYDWYTRWMQGLLKNQDEQFENHIFPLTVIAEKDYSLPNWLQGYVRYWEGKAVEAQEKGDEKAENQARLYTENAIAFGEHMQGITQDYQISYIELSEDIAVDKVCDIFTQINSRGIRLDAFDLINALLKPKGLQLKLMWREEKSRFEFVESDKMNVYILQVMSILKQAYCSPKYLYFLLPGTSKPVRDPDGTRRKEILVPDSDDFKSLWDFSVNILESSINQLKEPREFGVTSSAYLPYVSILPVFAAISAYIKELPHEQWLDAQRKLKLWYWASVFTNRYSGSVESTSARDYLDMKKWMKDSDAEPELIQDFKNRFGSLNLRSFTQRGSSIYNGIFNLLVLNGAKDWISGVHPHHNELDDHHIVPSSWGSKNLRDNIYHSVLNRTPLSSDTNRRIINDRLPNQYLPALIQTNGEQLVREIMESHLISPFALEILLKDPFTPDDFEAFISERQRSIQQAVENLLIKGRLDMPPVTRELDEKIEQTELRLRETVLSVLSGDVANLPPHILQKVEEKIHRAAAKNATMDIEKYRNLEGMLEYFDLRELQEIITSKVTWPTFEARFSNKETLNTKFGQLAELRNAIRHSRTIDEIARKEGEAALLWFEKVLRDV